MSATCINYTELRFTSESEMNRYISDIETIWHADIMRKLADNGMQRKSITRIWNHPDQFKLGVLWEYESPQAFQVCQKIISANILPHAHKFGMVARSHRGVPILDWRGDGFKQAGGSSTDGSEQEILADEQQ